MLPKPPPREASPGFLYLPPFRIYGQSIAGEATCLQIPELDLGFDIGACPRAMLSSKHLAISHGHMDHIGALAYYCSQRRFQGMGTAKIVCDQRIAPAIKRMMDGFVDLERQRTPYEIVPLLADQPVQIKNNIILRGFETEHTAPSFGYTVVEKRTKLREQYHDLPQEKLRELKERGVEITRAQHRLAKKLVRRHGIGLEDERLPQSRDRLGIPAGEHVSETDVAPEVGIQGIEAGELVVNSDRRVKISCHLHQAGCGTQRGRVVW